MLVFAAAVVNRMANWCASALGLQEGDVVALVMSNRPEFVIMWLAMAKIGVVTAFINHNLRGRALAHCMRIAHAKAVVYDDPHRGAVADVFAEFSELRSLQAVALGGKIGEPVPSTEDDPLMRPHAGAQAAGSASWAVAASSSGAAVSSDSSAKATIRAAEFDAAAGLRMASADRPSRLLRSTTNILSTFGLIYTSGTTGLPKASVITHSRLHMAACLFSRIYHVGPSDRIYTVLPLYHASGGLIGAGIMLYQGATLVIRPKFSARAFWGDCRRHRCTVVQYIGELCRYLVNAPKGDPKDEREHGVRIAIGNGLRPDVWGPFQDRFCVPEVGEFYAATEGNTGLFNWCRTEADRGAVGRMGPLAWSVGIMSLVRFNEETEEPIRDGATGLCQACEPGEQGELLGLIADGDPSRAFKGYFGNKKATAKKILTDVHRKGDKYFRSGDLLVRDAAGRFWFKDRIGDTFRWKGENVATTEVAEVMGRYSLLAEANVYGVEVPGKDGRAGMAAIVLAPEAASAAGRALEERSGLVAAQREDDAVAAEAAIQSEKLVAMLRSGLPAYAVPVFLRVLPAMDTTGTFKHQKVQLRKAGADPTTVADPLLVLDAASGRYVPLTARRWADVCSEKSKL
jgi:acyl-CoA synthetase (AMP-forming)/AMP-acid ligase II